MKRTAVIEYDYNEEASDIPGVFGMDADHDKETWSDELVAFGESDEKSATAYFMGLVDSGKISGSRLMMLAFAGWKSPEDIRLMLINQALSGLNGLISD